MIRDSAFYRRIGALTPKHINKNCVLCNARFVSRGTSQLYCSLVCNLLNRIDVRGPDECWEWQGTNCRGYGRVTHCKRTFIATREVYKIFHGSIPDEHLVCHSCDNPKCCNPSHFWVGTHGENQKDAAKKNRKPFGENSYTAVLTARQVAIIREMPLEIFTRADIARLLECSWSTISRVVSGEYWRRV